MKTTKPTQVVKTKIPHCFLGRPTIVVTLVLLLAAFPGMTTRAQIVIDSFNAGPFSLTIQSGQDHASVLISADPSEVIGGFRFVELP